MTGPPREHAPPSPGDSTTSTVRGTGPNQRDRRDAASRAALLRRVGDEFDQMPGLILTVPQAGRLFGLREDICLRVLDTLVQAEALSLDETGMYALRSRDRVDS
jgi:hypothetical protein